MSKRIVVTSEEIMDVIRKNFPGARLRVENVGRIEILASLPHGSWIKIFQPNPSIIRFAISGLGTEVFGAFTDRFNLEAHMAEGRRRLIEAARDLLRACGEDTPDDPAPTPAAPTLALAPPSEEPSADTTIGLPAPTFRLRRSPNGEGEWRSRGRALYCAPHASGAQSEVF